MKIAKKISENLRTVSTYSLVGIGTAIGYLILYILMIEILGFRPLIASILGYLPGLIIGYILCYKWVFRSNLSYKATSIKYFSVNGMGYLVNTFGIFILVETLDVDYLLGQLVTFVIVALHNYLFNYYWTFQKNQD
tara:strand:+ start:62 stop:469 length:408 start_codon:yes stop_codon:yes gene_type:complete